jgi:hypothetical protein
MLYASSFNDPVHRFKIALELTRAANGRRQTRGGPGGLDRGDGSFRTRVVERNQGRFGALVLPPTHGQV